MSFIRAKQDRGSMFRRSFALIAACILFSILNTGLLLMMFYGSFWKENRLTALSKDAFRLAQGIEALISASGADGRISGNEEGAMVIASSMQSVANSSGCDILIIDRAGSVMLCNDMITLSGKGVSIAEKCSFHDSVVFPASILSAMDPGGTTFEYDGTVDGFGADEYFLSVAPIKRSGELYCYIVLMQMKSVAFKPYTAEFSSMLILSALIAVALAFIAALGVSYRIIQPLKKISEATKHYARGDFSVRINEKESYKEINDLAVSVNSMAENLAVTEESRSNFVANISHELKTPMTIISGFIDGILDGTVIPAERDKYLNIISDEIKRLSRLVVSMLNMSKIEAGKLSLNYADVELSSLIFKTVLTFEKGISDKKIDIIGLDTMQRTVISADGALINQIIYNIVDNAVKFTPECGKITFGLALEKKEAVIRIRNTGRGISEVERGLVFERFYKVDKSRGLDSKSFGMGLYIVKCIVDLHKGSICINSEPDEYTEFVIRLPV